MFTPTPEFLIKNGFSDEFSIGFYKNKNKDIELTYYCKTKHWFLHILNAHNIDGSRKINAGLAELNIQSEKDILFIKNTFDNVSKTKSDFIDTGEYSDKNKDGFYRKITYSNADKTWILSIQGYTYYDTINEYENTLEPRTREYVADVDINIQSKEDIDNLLKLLCSTSGHEIYD